MRRIVSLFTIFSFLFFGAGKSQAAIPVLLHPAVLGTSIAIAAGAGIYLKDAYESGDLFTSNAGDIATEAWAVQKVITISGQEYLYGKAVSAGMLFNDIKTAVMGSLTSYPKFAGKLDESSTDSLPAVGDIINSGLVVSSWASYDSCPGTPVADPTFYYPSTCDGVLSMMYNMRSESWCPSPRKVYSTQNYQLNCSVEPDTDLTQIDTVQFATMVNSDPADVTEELGAIMIANPTKVTVYDTNNPIVAFPGSSPILEPITAEMESGLYDLAQVQYLQDVATDILIASELDPENTDLQTLALETQTAADLAVLQAEQDLLAAVVVVPVLPTIEPIYVDFAPLLGLQSLAMTKWPFNYVVTVGGWFSGLSATPKAPSFKMYWGGNVTDISLEIWDSSASVFRIILAFFFHAGVAFFIIRRWS